MRELTRLSSVALRPYVRSISYAPPSPGVSVRELILPGVATSLWINLNQDEFRRFLGPGHAILRTTEGAMVTGATDRAMVIEIEAGRSHVCVDFNLGGTRLFFRPDADVFRNDWIALSDVWRGSGSVARDRLLDEPNPAAKVNAIERILLEHVIDAPAPDPAIEYAAEALSRGERVGSVADRLGLLPRTLRRRFVKVAGLTPKRFARVERLRRLTGALATAASFDWARLAFEHGYSDQAHLNDDFRDLVGVTPTYYAANRVNGPNHVALPTSAAQRY